MKEFISMDYSKQTIHNIEVKYDEGPDRRLTWDQTQDHWLVLASLATIFLAGVIIGIGIAYFIY